MKVKILLATAILLLFCQQVTAGELLHPLNKRNIAIGLMPYPKYFPEVPRVTAVYAKHLYDKGKGFFIGVSTHDVQIVGGMQMSEREVWDTDFGSLNIPDDKAVIVY